MTPPQSSPPPKVSVAVIMLFQVSALFVRELVRLKLTQAGATPEVARDQSAWFGFLTLGVLMYPYWHHRRALLTAGFRRPSSWPGLILTSLAIGVSTRIASWGVTFVNASFAAIDARGEWQTAETSLLWQCPDVGALLLGVVTLAIATPAIEEVVNRGYILPALIRNRCKLPVLTSACLFAVLHRPDSMLVALMFGIVVAVQLMHCRSLWGPAIAHATFNLLFVMDGHCLRYPKLEAALLSLPPLTLAVLGAAIGVAAFLLAVRIARWTGAATR